MRTLSLPLLAIAFLLASKLHALPVPMEPAERTLFVFVHGINPRSSGAIESGDPCTAFSALFPDRPCPKSDYCVDYDDRKGDAALVWLRDLDENPSEEAIFCSLNKRIFERRQYSLRSFSDPGESPVLLAHELGDRTWKNDEAGLHSHVTEAMRRYLNNRRDSAIKKATRTEFEQKLCELYPMGSVQNLRPIFDAYPDSVPSRVVVLAHSMGGLTTREYLASDYFNGDLDKVVTYDSPHGGSWVAKYNQGGVWTPTAFAEKEIEKFLLGQVLINLNYGPSDELGVFFLISAKASLVAGAATHYSGYVANKFLGNEKGNWYLPPNGEDLKKVNALERIACEQTGCRVPSFVLHGVDGVLAPDDPGKLAGTGPVGYLLPLEAVDAGMAFRMAAMRDWPGSLTPDKVLGSALVAGNFAFGGWNYSQHGSLLVPLNSSRGDGIPFLARPEVRRRWRVTDWNTEGLPQLKSMKRDVGQWEGLGGHVAIIGALTLLARAQPWLDLEVRSMKTALGWVLGAYFSADMGAYAWSMAPSHNVAIWRNATRTLHDTIIRGDGSKNVIAFSEAESDLYESPFVNLVSERTTDSTADSVFILGIGTGSGDAVAYGIQVPVSQFQEIRYESTGWEQRWAVREEKHVPVQDSSTRVRLVKRRNLPAEILTKSQISSLDFQIDDLRPDLMEQMTVVLNYGMFRFVWDRDHDLQGNPVETFTFHRFQSGRQDSVAYGVPNPIDAYGRWRVPLKRMIPSQLQVLIDGQNRIGVSLRNHVGQLSAQSQFITFQATPPVVTMEWPRPWSVVSDVGQSARFEANLLYYKGIRFDTAGAYWSLAPENTRPDSIPKFAINDLLASDSVQTLELPLLQAFGSGDDGKWELQLQIQDVQDVSKQKGTPAARRYPFWLDRSPPVFNVKSEPHALGEAWRFLVTWNDAPAGLADAVELVRLRIRDLSGKLVAELAPLEFVTGGKRLIAWDGLVQEKRVPDGRYVLEVIGKDGAYPNKNSEIASLALRRELLAGLDSGAAIWTTRRDSIWNALRTMPHMNWASATDTFLVDRTPPRLTARPAIKRVIGMDDRLSLPLHIADLGASSRKDSIRLRFSFMDSSSGRAFVAGMVVGDVSGDTLHPSQVFFTEDSMANSLLPDGAWSVSVIATDAEDNADTLISAWTVRIDRTPPKFVFMAPSLAYVSSSAGTISAKVGMEIRGADSITAAWRLPNGELLPALPLRLSDSMWTVAYPSAMKKSPGTWVLEAVALDGAGNAIRSSTFVLVDLIPPRLSVPDQIQGPVVLKGLAMDPQLDGNAFRSYELSWRGAGDSSWRHDGMRIPLGRGVDSIPWRSRMEQSVDGVLGFWDPPQVVGSVELRVSVDDGTGRVFESVSEAYVSSRDTSMFSVNLSASPESLAAGVGARVGFDILASTSSRNYEAQAILVDARNAVLWSKHSTSLKAGTLGGRPGIFSKGSLHLWNEDGAWHLRSSANCRSFRAILQTWSSDSLAIACPSGWKCRQNSLTDSSYASNGDFMRTNRMLEWIIPAGSNDSVAWTLRHPGRISFLADSIGSSCITCSESNCDSSAFAQLLPAQGEIRMGAQGHSPSGAVGAINLIADQGSLSESWDGYRQNGNWPDGDSAILEADVWDSATGRVEHARIKLAMRSGTLRLGARTLGSVLLAKDAPLPQKRAVLEFTVEGRGASVATRIERNGTVLKTLQGSGSWREGRPAGRPYALDWDGTDSIGMPVPSGTYRFVVDAEGVKAESDVEVGGFAWTGDSSLRFSIAPGEADWSPGLNAWMMKPPPVLQVETGVEAKRMGGLFQYGVRYEGRQNVIAYRTQRPSLMIRRKRSRVKFGLLWKVTTMQEGYDSDESSWSGCGSRSGPAPVTNYYDGGVVEIGRGETVTREITEHVQPNPGETTYRMKDEGHVVEYAAVPLEDYVYLLKPYRLGEINDKEWNKSISNAFVHGSFTIDKLTVTPTYGENEDHSGFVNETFTNKFASKPNPPRKCGRFVAMSENDSTLDHKSWIAGLCADSDRDAVNPNRNLIWLGVRPTRTRWVGDFVSYKKISTYIWDNGTAGASCAPNHLTDFTFAFDMRVPDEFFDAEVGIDNLANRLLRFDAANSFLYGPDGFLVKDGYDNNGDGRIDDPGEAVGPMSPFERRSYQWRTVWEEPGVALHDCMGTRRKWLPIVASTDGSAPDNPGSGWVRTGEAAPCEQNSKRFCQEWRSETKMSCDEVNAGSNILQDKLNFFEGDHSLSVDSLQMWFTNKPEQGTSRFVAKVRQDLGTWSLDSRIQTSPASALRIGVSRGAYELIKKDIGSGSTKISVPVGVAYRSYPLQFTVSMQSDVIDAAATPGDLVRVAWPLDSLGWLREKAVLDGSCASLNASDPSSCRRIFAAASGPRFGLGDGLEPTVAGGTWTSLAQERFFSLRDSGIFANPDALPMGRIPSSSSRVEYTGLLRPDALGRSSFVDSLHFRGNAMEVPNGVDSIRAVPVAEGFTIDGPDSAGRVRFTGSVSESWTLPSDPRMGGAARLRKSVAWTAGSLEESVSLVDLYKASADPLGSGRQELGLFLESSTGILSPNTDVLADVRLLAPTVAWRDGSDASGSFEARSTAIDRTGYPGGLGIRHAPFVHRIPEWIAMQGGVPAGYVFQVGWSDSTGGWHPLTDSVVSSCASDRAWAGTCSLGMVDVSALPIRGSVLLRVANGYGWRFQAVSYVRGTTLASTGTRVVRSLFGDAQVVFPEGALADRSEESRTISVRVLPPSEVGLTTSSGVAVIGPVVEILPSQSFAGAVLPEIGLRLPRQSLKMVEGDVDPSSVQLYKVDPSTGMIVPLSSQRYVHLCDGAVCTAMDAWNELEFHARTASFSQFALLPKGLPDSRQWSISVDPNSDTSSRRKIVVQGVAPSSLSLFWDDDPNPSDVADPTHPEPAAVVWGGGDTGIITLPNRPVSWLVVRRIDGGLARSIRLVRFAEAFAFRSLASDTLFAGGEGAFLNLPYIANHDGELRLAIRAPSGTALGWVEAALDSGAQQWRLAIPGAWDALPKVVESRLIATDAGGGTVEVSGPVLVFDRNRPKADLAVTIRRERRSWSLRIVPAGSDDFALAKAHIVVSTSTGDTLATWNTLDPRELSIPDLAWSTLQERTVQVALLLEDRSGNRANASWSGSLASPELASLLWLVPAGSALYGWSVEDRGRHSLSTHVEGIASLRDEAILFQEPLARVVTESSQEQGILGATLELLGVWDTNTVLIERSELWSLRRDGRDIVFKQGDQEVRWASLFPERPRWMHLALSMKASELELFRDGRSMGSRSWNIDPKWVLPRAWNVGGGSMQSRLALVRVWGEAFDSAKVALWRTNALEIDSVRWIEAERFSGSAGLVVPRCELPSRLAFASGNSNRRIMTKVSGPRRARLAGRWIADGPRIVRVSLDGSLIDSVHLGERVRWEALEAWSRQSGDLLLDIPSGEHELELDVPNAIELDGVALVSGDGRIDRWTLPESVPEARVVDVLVRDESPYEANHFKPRLIVRNQSKNPLAGYWLHLQVREDAWHLPVVETWWPASLSSSLAQDGHGLFTWTMDRSAVVIPPGQSDFGPAGAAIGFHHKDWSQWTRWDDPSWDSSWATGAWVRSTGIPVFALDGRLLSEWTCRDISDLSYPAEAPEVHDTLTAVSPMVMEGARGRVLALAEGDWNWGSTVIGVSPVDGQPLSGMLRWGETSWPLSGWWQQIIIPNAAHSNLNLVLDLGSARKVQLQKWHQ